VSQTEESARHVRVGDVYEVDGLEWTVHRVAYFRVAACHRYDEHGVKHFRTFGLEKLRTARAIRLAEIP
jgi:hypothetical protein